MIWNLINIVIHTKFGRSKSIIISRFLDGRELDKNLMYRIATIYFREYFKLFLDKSLDDFFSQLFKPDLFSILNSVQYLSYTTTSMVNFSTDPCRPQSQLIILIAFATCLIDVLLLVKANQMNRNLSGLETGFSSSSCFTFMALWKPPAYLGAIRNQNQFVYSGEVHEGTASSHTAAASLLKPEICTYVGTASSLMEVDWLNWIDG